MDVPPGSGVTSETAPAHAALLRRAWFEVAATAAPQLADLPLLLDARLTELTAAGRLDESSLLSVAEEASQYAMEQGAGDVARALSKRLRRAIYEFLLALDAVNPAELAPAAALPVTPAAPLPADPRVPMALTQDDVQGGDESPATAAVEPVEARPVPLWEQMSTPAQERQVYRVASREVTPETEETEAEAAVPESDPVVEQYPDVEAVMAEVFDDPGPDDALHVEEVESAEPQAGAEEAPTATEEAETPVVEVEAIEPPVEPAAAESNEVPEWGPASAPVSTWSPVVDVPAVPADSGSPPNGVKAPRDLLRVPRQFRRLPPLPGRQHVDEHPDEETLLPGEPAATAWTSLPADTTVTSEPEAAVAPPEAAEATPAAGDDEDALGVPALPWPVEAAAETEAPVAPIDEELEEEMGLPFTPLADIELPAEVDAPKVVEEPAPSGHAEEPAPLPVAELPAPPVEEPAPLPLAELPAPPAEEPALHIAADLPTPPADEPALQAAAYELPTPPPVAELPAPPPVAEAPAPAPQPFFDPFATAPAPDPFGYPDLPPSAAPAAPAAQPGMPWTPVPIAPSAAPFPIAPREGFHLTDPGALDLAFGNDDEPLPAPPPENPFTAAIPPVSVPQGVHIAPPAPPAPTAPAAPAAPAASPASAADHNDDDPGVWRVRQSPRAQLLAERMAQKRREEAARAAFDAASVQDDTHGRKRRRGEEPLPDMSTARRQLDEHLRKKRGAEAGALLQRLAQEMGGREIADLALDSGDRCRALGQSRSATNCYLAAWRADPLYETPLWRLSDVCLNEQEIDLAVGYLERIADLMRSRGDDEGAIGVYRKIAMIAPERQDVRDVIRLAKTTGRLDV